MIKCIEPTKQQACLGLLPSLVLASTALFAGTALAVPVLQIGAPAGPGDTGAYADYVASSTNPTEDDTAFTGGNTIFVAGVYKNNNVLHLGGQSGSGQDWSGVDSNYAPFDGKGAVLLAAVPDGSLATAVANLTVNGSFAFTSSALLSGLFPNNHDPLKDNVSDFLFFDIGDFQNLAGAVPDLVPETGAADGEIKSLTLGGTSLLEWIHFDVLALETSTQGNTAIRTTIENNPGSHDVTWKNPGSGPGPTPALSPAPLALIALGLLGISSIRRKKINSV